MLEYKIVKRPQFTVVGIARKFNNATAYKEIPKFWQEHVKSELIDDICGDYGICFDDGKDGEFTYYIADDYIPWAEYPQTVEIKVIPAHTWAVFACEGKLPQSLQKLNDEIWKQWLTNNGKYCLADNFNIEFYLPTGNDSDENYSEIWLPVRKINK